MRQLTELAKPFPDSLIATKPNAAKSSYVSHSTVTERALSIVGPYSTDVMPVRGYAPQETTKTKTYPEQHEVIVGALVTVRCVIDGRAVSVTEAGDVENPLQKGNDGARLKDAISDGIKRCWMRLGLGLHLWSQNDYFLHAVLERDEEGAKTPPKPSEKPEPYNVPQEALDPAETTPPREHKPLGAKRGADMRAHLEGMGFKDRDIETLLLLAVTERDVPTLADLTDPEAKAVMKESKRIVAEREKKDDEPPFDPNPEPENFAPDGPGTRLLTNTEASSLHKALAKFGIKQHYDFASEVLGRKVVSLQALRVDVSIRVYEAALAQFGTPGMQGGYQARKATART